VIGDAAPPEPVEVLLADGGSAELRAITPADAPALVAFHHGLSAQTIHFRYFSALVELPKLLLHRFTQVDFARDMVLVAEVGAKLIALASWHRGKRPDDGDAAEVAFVVADEHQGRGLGTLLLERLAELARARGLTRFRAETLAGNRAMLHVFRDAGFALERDADDVAVVHLRFPVADTDEARAAHEQREHRAELRSIARLLAPRAVLALGDAAEDAAGLRGRGFRGTLYTDLQQAPLGVDLALWRGDAKALPDVIAACAAAGVHALQLGALAGEPAGDERERFDRELRVAVRRNGMRLVGPDSFGLIHTAPSVQLCTAPLPEPPARGAIGLACDSAALARELLVAHGFARAGLSTFAGLGRRADVSANDLLQYWQDDPATRVVALAVHSPGNPAKLERIAAHVASAKPIVALACGGEHDARLRAAGAELVHSPAELALRARALA